MAISTGIQEGRLCCLSAMPNRFVPTCCRPLSKSPHYGVYLLGIFFIQTGHITALSMLPTRSRTLGISKTLGASLVSILGGTGGIARGLFGAVGDWRKLNRTLVVGLSGVLSGLLTCVIAALTNYPQIAGVTAILGVTSGML